MDNWKESNIKMLGTVFTNNTFSRDCLNYDSGEYQNIHYGDVLITFSDIIDANSPLVPYINSNETVKSDTLIEDGDIIVADTAEDETVGKVCEIQNVGKRKIVSGLHTLWYRPNKNEFAPKYLGYLLNTFECHKQLVRKAHGIKVLSINKGDFWKTIIKYPASLEEQNAIAGIISKVDQCIENTQNTIDATQKLKKSLMQNLLTGRMKPDGTMRKDNEFYEHPKIGKVPIGWEVKKIKELFYVRAGGDLKEQYFSSEKTEIYKYPIYSNTLVDKGLYGFTSLPLFPKDTITIAGRGVGIGHVEYRDTEYDAIVRLNVLILKENLDYFVKYFSYLISHTVHFVNESTGVPQLTAPAIRINYIAFPKDKKIQEYISNQFDLIDKKILYKKQKIIFLQRLKKSLMQTLLTGKKRVDVTKINSLLKTMK